MAVAEEGCLFLPGAHRPLARPDFAVCRGLDHNGHTVVVRGTGTLARCLQHATDHLNGIVVEDHLSPGERSEPRRQHATVAADVPATWPT
ncbi:peptide deformylase [Pseudonocardia tropica]